MNKKEILFFLLLIFKLKLVACSIDKGGVFFKEISPLFITQEQDSLLKNRYLYIKKNIKNNELSKSLELSLKFLDDSKNNNNVNVEFLSTYLIGDIFLKLNNHDKAIEYLNKSLRLFSNSNLIGFDKEVKKNDINFNKNKALANNYFKLGTEYYKKELKIVRNIF